MAVNDDKVIDDRYNYVIYIYYITHFSFIITCALGPHYTCTQN